MINNNPPSYYRFVVIASRHSTRAHCPNVGHGLPHPHCSVKGVRSRTLRSQFATHCSRIADSAKWIEVRHLEKNYVYTGSDACQTAWLL